MITMIIENRDVYSCLLEAKYEYDYEYDQKKICEYNTSMSICQKKFVEYEYEYILEYVLEMLNWYLNNTYVIN